MKANLGRCFMEKQLVDWAFTLESAREIVFNPSECEKEARDEAWIELGEIIHTIDELLGILRRKDPGKEKK